MDGSGRDGGQILLPQRIGAEERDRSGAEALHRERELGEAGRVAERFANQAERPHVEFRAGRRRDGVLQPAGLAKLRDVRAARRERIVVVLDGQMLIAPRFDRALQRAMRVVEERPVEIGAVWHMQCRC